MNGQTEFIITPRHAAYVTRVLYIAIYARNLTSPVTFFDAKSEKIFQDAIMAEQVPYFQLCFDFSTVENSNDFEEFSGEVACNLSSKILSSPIFCLK